jgi:hypothetical protein
MQKPLSVGSVEDLLTPMTGKAVPAELWLVLGTNDLILVNPAARHAGDFGIVAQLWTGCREKFDLQTITDRIL